MSLEDFIKSCDRWAGGDGPKNNSIISSRARYARNLEHIPFAPRARTEQLRAVLERIDEAISKSPYFENFKRLTVSDINSLQRCYLKESHLISSELEQGGEHRVLYISPDYRISIMINEEDHLRMQCIDVGFQVPKVLAILDEVEAELGRLLNFAKHERFGYLTACPTNTGNGLRISVMLHMPGLVLINKIEEITKSIAQYGLTVRGIYGENSEHTGDFFQISNEVTLGQSGSQTRETLESVAEQLLEREIKARNALFEQKPLIVRDLVARALAILKNASIIDSTEAMTHLSKIRLGIDRGWFEKELMHSDLSRLMVLVQPAHLQCEDGNSIPPERRDNRRAEILQNHLRDISLN